MQGGSPEKKNPAQAVSKKKKKKFVRAENSPPPSPPPHHFSNGPSLRPLRRTGHAFRNIGYKKYLFPTVKSALLLLFDKPMKYTTRKSGSTEVLSSNFLTTFLLLLSWLDGRKIFGLCSSENLERLE